MENASKALIIAGAILISILLITIGIVLINSGRDVVDTGTAGMNSQQIQTFNAQFTPYEGTKKGSEIRGLWNAVASSNGAYKDSGHEVDITPDKLTDLSGFSSMKNYTVTLNYDDNGYINTINVAAAAAS